MGKRSGILAVCALLLCSLAVRAEDAPVKNALETDQFKVTYVKLGAEKYEGLLFEPRTLGPKARIAIVYSFPRTTGNGNDPKIIEMVHRGYRAFQVRAYTDHDSPYDGLADISAAIAYMRTVPGVERVILAGHSGGARQVSNYANYALNGPAGCQRPQLLYPCQTQLVRGFAKPDGLIVLDLPPGPIFTVTSMDPAYVKGNPNTERSDLDMYSPANGYDPKTHSATYTPEFRKRFFAAQSARNMQVINDALARLRRVEQGKDEYAGDAPLTIPGVVTDADNGWALAHPDISLMSHTKRPHIVLKGDGTIANEIVRTSRDPQGPSARGQSGANRGERIEGDENNEGGSRSERAFIDQLSCCAISSGIRNYLMQFATRTTKDYEITEDDMKGIDWLSNVQSAVGALQGVTIPTLIEVNTCYHFVTSSEIAFDHLAAKDKTLVALDGAAHNFTPCKPGYGDTKTRVFNFIDGWVSKPGRFL